MSLLKFFNVSIVIICSIPSSISAVSHQSFVPQIKPLPPLWFETNIGSEIRILTHPDAGFRGGREVGRRRREVVKAP